MTIKMTTTTTTVLLVMSMFLEKAMAEWPPLWVQQQFPAQTQQWAQQTQSWGQQQQQQQTKPKKPWNTMMSMMSMHSAAKAKGMMGMMGSGMMMMTGISGKMYSGMMGMGMMHGVCPKWGCSRRRELEAIVDPSDPHAFEAPPLPSTYEYNPVLSDLDWLSFSIDDFGDALQCNAEYAPADVRAIHDVATWRQLRETYTDVVGSARSSIERARADIDSGMISKTAVAAQDADFLRAMQIPTKGRGIVATRDIKKGEKMWSDMYLASFYERSDLNRFLAVLPTELACDVILWTYEQDDEDLENFYFSVDLDLGTFCNDGGSKASNVEWGFDPTISTAYASRNIKAGEEILCDYEGDYDYSEEADEDEDDDDEDNDEEETKDDK